MTQHSSFWRVSLPVFSLKMLPSKLLDIELYPYQEQALEWMIQREKRVVNGICGGILADEVGLGKTIQILALCCAHRHTASPTLIVAPNSIIIQWREACETLLGLAPLVVTASDMPSERTMAKLAESSIVLVHMSCFQQKTVDYDCHPLTTMLFERVIFDEVHWLKNTKTKLASNLAKVRSLCRWGLTGTPIVNSKNNLAALLAFLMKTTDVSSAKELIVEDTPCEFVLRRTKQSLGYMESVPLERRVEVLDFSTHGERAEYGRQYCIGRAMIGNIGRAKGYEIGEFLHVIAKLRRLCVCRSKVQALLDAFDEHPHGTRSLVFCNWIDEIDTYATALAEKVDIVMKFQGSMSLKERNDVVSTFMDTSRRESMVIVMQIDAGGIGLNLQQASKVYIMSPHWNATSELQAIGRAHRNNTPHPVTVTRFVMQDSIEQYIHKTQQDKLATAAEVLGDDHLMMSLHATNGINVSWTEVEKIFELDVFPDCDELSEEEPSDDEMDSDM